MSGKAKDALRRHAGASGRWERNPVKQHWDSAQLPGGWVGGKDLNRKENSRERPGEHLKSHLWVVPLAHPVYFISLFVILTHSWEQGKFVLLPLLSSLKNSTPRSGCGYHLAPSWFSLWEKTNTSCKITFATYNSSPAARFQTVALHCCLVFLPRAGQETLLSTSQ